jgi:uridine kinase
MALPPPPHFDLSVWADSSPLIIGIAGGSGSGKTTISQALTEAISGVTLIRHDDYYRDRPELSFEQRSRLNYDHPDSLESDLLAEHLASLRAGQPIRRPVYDFTDHLRSDEVVTVAPAPVVVVEGILVLAEAQLREFMDLKVYVDTDADLRLARRLQRDITERERTPESVLRQYLATVRPMHLEFVERSKRHRAHSGEVPPGRMRELSRTPRGTALRDRRARPAPGPNRMMRPAS